MPARGGRILVACSSPGLARAASWPRLRRDRSAVSATRFPLRLVADMRRRLVLSPVVAAHAPRRASSRLLGALGLRLRLSRRLPAGRGGGAGGGSPYAAPADLGRARTSTRRSSRSARAAHVRSPTTSPPSSSFLASLAALIGALALVGVRDVRCYAAVCHLGAGVERARDGATCRAAARAWRWRSSGGFATRLWRPAAALGVAVSVKLFLWPLLVWALARRAGPTGAVGPRVGGDADACARGRSIGSPASVVPRAALRDRTSARSYSLIADVAAALGFGPWSDAWRCSLSAEALLVAVARVGAPGRRDRLVHAARSVAALALSPVVWLHYLVLLAVPLAIAARASPRSGCCR